MASQALPKRSTRGQRMNKLLEDEDSADEEFWNQDAFAEEEDDGQYESESEQADVFDADFDDDESSSDSEEVVVARERRKPALKAPERKTPAAPREKKSAAPRAPRGLDSSLAGSFQGDASTWDGGLRKSSRSGVKEVIAQSEAAREAAKARPAPKRNPNAEPPRQLTQAEILAEAAVTEVANLQDLERLLNIEEAVKKKAERVKKTYSGPSVRARSKKVDGVERTTLETRMGATLPAPLGAPRPGNPGDGAVRHHGRRREIQRSPHWARVPRRRRLRRDSQKRTNRRGRKRGRRRGRRRGGRRGGRRRGTGDGDGGGSGGGSGSGGARRGRGGGRDDDAVLRLGGVRSRGGGDRGGIPRGCRRGCRPRGGSRTRTRARERTRSGPSAGTGVEKSEKNRLPKRLVTRGRGATLEDGTRIDA